MTVSQALVSGGKRLKAAGVEAYSLDCRLILMHSTGLDEIELFTQGERILTPKEEKCFISCLKRREKNEPIAYITGKKEFMGLEFKVNAATLIPRPDTEILVEAVIEEGRKNGFGTFLDIGTGSGAIAVSVAKYMENAVFDGVDVSKAALSAARENAELNCVSQRVSFFESDIYNNIKNKKYDCIISNPPYIETKAIAELDADVRVYEPISALDGGEDGLLFYKKIISGAFERLNKKGMLFFEIGFNQAESVSELMKAAGFEELKVLKDLAEIGRAHV